MKFTELGLAEPILRAVEAEGYAVATPIQFQSIPHVLRRRDVLGCAQTGTGKTAAFALPILHRLTSVAPPPGAARVRCLVLCPTRELATQIADSFRTYGRHTGIRNAVIFGGVNQNPQADALRRGTDVLVATPGRLLDLINQGYADLSRVEVLVLDEADRMLDMGFIHDIRRIVARLPAERQTLMFSATMPGEIRSLANTLLRNPATVQVAPVASTVDKVDQSVYFVERRNKPALLAHLVKDLAMYRAIVFTRTKHGADRVVRHLHTRGIRAEAIHGNKSQNNRERALKNFKADRTPILVATDIASRGIDVDGISHVVNYDLTHEPETYVHRIGRTARAGASGTAVSFCDPAEEMPNLKAIEKLIRRAIPVKTDQPEYPKAAEGAGGNGHRQGHRQGHRSEGTRPDGRRHHAGRGVTPRAGSEGRADHRSNGPARSHASSQEHQPQYATPHRQGAGGHAKAAAGATRTESRPRHPLYGHVPARRNTGRGRPTAGARHR
jgi:ATP-dependent RNA helicase RhlE